MEITLNLQATKLTAEQWRMLGKITDREQWPLKEKVKVKASESEKHISTDFLKARGKWEITK